jgi:hypothetical protein
MTDQRGHDGEGFDGAAFDEDDLPVRRPSPVVRIVAVVVVVAVALSVAAVVVGVLTSDDDERVDASGARASESASAEVSDPSRTPQPPSTLESMTTQMSPCEPLGPADIAEVLAVASVDVVAAAPDEIGCRVAAAPWTVSYSRVESAEPIGSIPAEPLAIGDEAFVTTSNDRSGNWTATGFVRANDRMMVLTVQSDARGVDTYPGDEGPPVQPQVRERAVALLEALAARL